MKINGKNLGQKTERETKTIKENERTKKGKQCDKKTEMKRDVLR